MRLSALEGDSARDEVLAAASSVDETAGTYDLSREEYRRLAWKRFRAMGNGDGKMKRYLLKSVHAAASGHKPGYLDAVMAASRVDGDSVEMSDEDAARIGREYRKDLPAIDPTRLAAIRSSHLPRLRSPPCVHLEPTGAMTQKKCCGGKTAEVPLMRCKLTGETSPTCPGCERREMA